MKPVQWIIGLAVLALMVFVITFAMNFLGESSTANNGPKPPDGEPQLVGEAILRFPETNFHGLMGHYYEQETKHAGHHDFLFGNPKDETVALGLQSVGCGKCTFVEILLASDEMKLRLEPWLNRTLLPDALSGALRDKMILEAPENLKATKLETGKQVTIPPKAVGWVRMRWTDDQFGVQLFKAELWTKDKIGEAYTRLETSVRFSDPVKFQETEIVLDQVQVEDLQNHQKPKIALFKLWSSTRSELHLKSTLLARWKPGEAPIIIGEPEPMKPAELAELERQLQKSAAAGNLPPPAPLACAYRLPVTLLDRSKDGKNPFPFGPFRTRIQLTFSEEGIEPATIMIKGELLGDVRIGGGTEGRLSFGSFEVAQGSKTEHVMLYSDVPGLELAIDMERTPEFLAKNAKIEKIAAGGETSWKVSTKVAKNGIVGQFPRENSEYFDCAVYVKTKGDSSRSLRIPADGAGVEK